MPIIQGLEERGKKPGQPGQKEIRPQTDKEMLGNLGTFLSELGHGHL